MVDQAKVAEIRTRYRSGRMSLDAAYEALHRYALVRTDPVRPELLPATVDWYDSMLEVDA